MEDSILHFLKLLWQIGPLSVRVSCAEKTYNIKYLIFYETNLLKILDAAIVFGSGIE